MLFVPFVSFAVHKEEYADAIYIIRQISRFIRSLQFDDFWFRIGFF